MLARGIRLTAAESASIVPMLVVFTALFGYLLVTIHDTGMFIIDDLASDCDSWMISHL